MILIRKAGHNGHKGYSTWSLETVHLCWSFYVGNSYGPFYVMWSCCNLDQVWKNARQKQNFHTKMPYIDLYTVIGWPRLSVRCNKLYIQYYEGPPLVIKHFSGHHAYQPLMEPNFHSILLFLLKMPSNDLGGIKNFLCSCKKAARVIRWFLYVYNF